MENHTAQPPPSSKGKWWRKFKAFADPLFKMEKREWLEDMRGNLSMVAALISAITFQAALNPPGGVVQTSTGTDNTLIGCNSSTGQSVDGNNICTGEAVLAVVYSVTYLYYIKFNSFSFVASLSAALLLVSGIPLRHRFPMWFLSIAMSASLTSLAATYLCGVLLVTPDPVYGAALESFKKFMFVWIGFLLLISLFITIRFLVWVVKKCRKLYMCGKNKRNLSASPEINVA
ncbi:hypothetical protein L6164_031587 [Bauhinia variegata]|uniref:Uncharacterized protein n=1 Tax=Bauhinia variegata TaxID=167791 RepID=A0ACB9LH17_BAUVA|nr:hypothetical protein L6164_031587 [Bauhinia variegata]